MLFSKKKSDTSTAPAPIKLYDHLPGILAGIPAFFFAIFALLQLGNDGNSLGVKLLSSDTIFWLGLAVAVFWYVAVRFNLPKKRFFQVFGLVGTFIGIPTALELVGQIRFFGAIGDALGALRPQVSAGAWAIVALAFAVGWLANLIWSRAHMRVVIKDGQLIIKRFGGRTDTFDLIGLKTEEEPLDYAETFAAGFGKIALKTRTGVRIFQMNRVFGLYWVWWLPWRTPKIKRIQEALSVDAKVITQRARQADVIEAMEVADTADADSEDDDGFSDDDRDYDEIDREDDLHDEQVEREVR